MIQLRSTAPTFTRPSDTTQYTSGDLVANSTTAASVAALQFKFDRTRFQGALSIRKFVLTKSGTGVTTPAFRLHLFHTIPTFVTGGDNSAISTVVETGAANWLGMLDITAMTAVADGAFGDGAPTAGSDVIIEPASMRPDSAGNITIYGILEARNTYTPASAETFTPTIAGVWVAEAGR